MPGAAHFDTPGRTRTCDPLLRRQMLYPPELRERARNCTRLIWLRQPATSWRVRQYVERALTKGHLFFKIQTPVVVKAHLPLGQPFGGENYLAGVVAEMLDDVEDRVEDRHFVGLR